MLGGSELKRPKIKRTRTTNLTDFAPVRTVPRELRARVLSPTRRQNPHPLGLRYQSPLSSDAQAYAIWNPDFRHSRARFPELITHLDLTNLSCGTTSPCVKERAGPPIITYSMQSTSRSSFKDPNSYPLMAGLELRTIPTRYDHRPDDGPAIGAVPRSLPRLMKRKDIINVMQGDEEDVDEDILNLPNSAIRAIWRYTGIKPFIGFQDENLL